MADLKNATITDELSVPEIRDSTSTKKIDVETVSLNGFMTRRIINQTHQSSWSTSSTRRDFNLAHTFPEITGFKAGSLVHLSYHIPTRNNNTNWGGIFVEPQVQFNGGSWYSLGGSGYDLMYHSSKAISSYFNSVMFDPEQTQDFSIRFRFYLAGHDGSTEINGSHSLGTRSNSSSYPDLPGDNSLQHYWSLKIEELAKLGG